MKIAGLPALTSVASTRPKPGTSSTSVRRPVGNSPDPGASLSSAAGSMNSSLTSAAGNATPSSSNVPSSTTSPSRIGTRATIGLPMLACQIRTVASPSAGALAMPLPIAMGPTAALRLPQLPDQSITGRSTATAPKR